MNATPILSFRITQPAPLGACPHCGDTPQAGTADGFCCPGCRAAYTIIHDMDLGQFYLRRTRPQKPLLRPLGMDRHDLPAYATAAGNGHWRLYLMVDGLSCPACVWLIEAVLAQQTDVTEGRVNLTTNRLVISWQGEREAANNICDRLTTLGFRLAPFNPEHSRSAYRRQQRELMLALAVAGFATGNVMLFSVSLWSGAGAETGGASRDLFHWISALIALPALAFSARPFVRSAINALRNGRINMDVPVSIGVILTALVSLVFTIRQAEHTYFDGAIMLVFFLLIGRILDHRARGIARSAVEHLLALTSTGVRILDSDGTIRVVLSNDVATGQRVLVAPGERIGVDGTLLQGMTTLDTSLVTGESLPVAAGPGTAVFAGTINLSVPVEILAGATGDSTLLASIARLMEVAEHGRGRYVLMADRLARLYAPLVHGLALGTGLVWAFVFDAPWDLALLNAVAVLIITCPCALALAVPAVQVVASGRLMQQGTLLKSATALERLATVSHVVLDKTGTLTEGRLELVRDGNWMQSDLDIAARLAACSRHPLAVALLRAAPEAIPATKVEEHPGRGLSVVTNAGTVRLGSRTWIKPNTKLEDDGKPEMWLDVPGKSAARFVFADRPRQDAGTFIADCRRRGWTVEILSGDRAAAVSTIAALTGINQYIAEADPAAKVARLEALKQQGQRVLMIGDGLNDAAALMAAHVSVSPATAADITRNSADAIFQGELLQPVTELIATAGKAAQVMRQNLALALLYNAFALPLAVAGLVTPLIAAIAMSSSSLLVVGNALRLARHHRS